jgi:hypothetical protein
MKKIMMNKADLDIVNKIVEENGIDYNFWIVYTDSSGIGYTLDLEYETEINGRNATIRIPISGEENW